MKKRVVAMFTVDTDEDDGRWHKTDVALHIDCAPFDDNPDATVWDSLEDFLADLKEGHVK
jgi:hypothetical protein